MCNRKSIATVLMLACVFAAFFSAPLLAQETLEPIVVGQPTKIEVFPTSVKLAGPRRHMQIVVTGHYADGSLQDLTRAAQFAASDAAIIAVENAIAKPLKDGAAEVVVSVGGQQVKVPVEVTAQTAPQAVSFEYDM